MGQTQTRQRGTGITNISVVGEHSYLEDSEGGARIVGRSTREPWQDNDLPLTVKEAARFLGVSPQTVYLYVERKQIPHLRVMGRNIRFLKSDLRAFRAQFKCEVDNGTTKQA